MKTSKPIIIVSGLPRSGTSLMMQMLAAGGMPVLTDNLRQADVNNSKGYYEFEAVKNLALENDWLKQAQGKSVKVISHLLQYLPKTYTYKIILIDLRVAMLIKWLWHLLKMLMLCYFIFMLQLQKSLIYELF